MTDALRLQRFLRSVAARGRTVVEVAPFTVYVDEADPLRYLSYAIPADGARPDASQVEALRQAMRARDRLPRLEWVEEAAPDLAPVLAACGMAEELRAPLMRCGPDDLLDARAGVDGLVLQPLDDALLRPASDMQRIAFGDEPVPPDRDPFDPRTKGGGGVVATVDGEPVSVACWSGVADGMAEIWGVATAAAWRGRGLAGAVTRAAVEGAFASGAEATLLSPGSDEAQRVYARAGFVRAATSLYYADEA
jgi:ribosomal protein S18 acetylase RimI-like enzyme